MENHLLMAPVDNPEIREGNKDVGVLQAPRQYVPVIPLSSNIIAFAGTLSFHQDPPPPPPALEPVSSTFFGYLD